MIDDRRLIAFYVNLTPRQREVVSLVSEGRSNREVARALCIAPSVVAEHLTNIYALLNHLDEDPESQPNRYTLIRAFAGFFERHPELAG